MAHGARELMKRKVAQGVDHLSKAQQCVMDLGEFYAEDHPEIVEQLKVFYTYLGQGIVLFESFRQTY